MVRKKPMRLDRFFARIFLPLLALLAGCSDQHSPTAATDLQPPGLPDLSYYPDAGVLTSTGDTCPGYVVPPELHSVFWSGTDEQVVGNPDSVYAADSMKVAAPDYWEPLMLVDQATGAELFAGPCEVEWNRCQAKCRRMPVRDRRARAICWGACAARYALCKRREREQEAIGWGGCGSGVLVYDYYAPDEPCDDNGESGSGGEGLGLNCQTEWLVIEINDGDGWETWWQGWVLVCQ